MGSLTRSRLVSFVPCHYVTQLLQLLSAHLTQDKVPFPTGACFLRTEHGVPSKRLCVQVQVMGAMLTVAIFLGWVCVMGITLVRAWQGHLFRAYSPSQPMVKVRAGLPEAPAQNGTNGV